MKIDELIENVIDSEKISSINNDQECSNNEPIKDPTQKVVTKRMSKKNNMRIRSHFERRRTVTTRTNEYGTRTPIPRLF